MGICTSANSNRVGAANLYQVRRDDGAKVELGVVLKRAMEVVEIKEGMPIK